MDWMNKIDEIVEDLYQKQNIVYCQEQKSLYTRKEYYELVKPVIELIACYKDYTIDEFRNLLFEKSKIEDKVRYAVNEQEMVPGMVFSYGTKNYRETVVIGNSQEINFDQENHMISDIEKISEDTIFDLASTTKLFTSLSILKLVQDNFIKLEDKITKYAPQFKNLQEVTIFDLISFKVPLKTSKRVDKAMCREEAEQILEHIEIDHQNNRLNPYTDMGAMILKYVIENVSGMSYYNYLRKNILNPLSMNDTFVTIPKNKLDIVVSTNGDGKYYKDGNYIINTLNTKGIAYDPKAQVMGQKDGNLSGHAGLFSSAKDMTNLARNIIKGQILDEDYVEMLARNRTGRKYFDLGKEKYIQYLGFLCFSKHPISSNSEVFHALSGRSFASPGWTGTQLTVDPINELYFFLGSNRSHNRMTFIDPVYRDKIEINEKGKKTILLPDGSRKIDASQFAFERDEVIVHPALKLAIQYKILEDICPCEKREKIIKIR